MLSTTDPENQRSAYWALDAATALRVVGSSAGGLSTAEADRRLRSEGLNQFHERQQLTRLRVVINQIRNPLLLVLVFAAAAAAATGELTDALIVFVIVFATVGIGYTREYSAQTALAVLQARVRSRARVRRDGVDVDTPAETVVRGDIVLLSAGSLVPADGVILESADFFVSEAALTGESLPVEKRPGVVPAAATLRERTNCVFVGTNVRSGTATVIIAATGDATQFGAIARRLSLRPPETEFDRGLRRFGYLLTSTMIVMVFVVFIVHLLNGRPPIDTLLFSLALAVGLSPELLPAILSVNLARGAQLMARRGVLARRLNAIENLGSMDVLCTDKTGTLTEGIVRLEGSYDPSGAPAADVLKLASVNAALETGLNQPLDDAILVAHRPDLSQVRKLAEVPFDYARKRVSVVFEDASGVRLVSKGVFRHVLSVCTHTTGGAVIDPKRAIAIGKLHDAWSAQGIRSIAVASRALARAAQYGRTDEQDMTFEGFLTFLDRPKEDAAESMAALTRLGVAVKIITGDAQAVTQHVATLVGMRADRVLTGEQLQHMADEALWHAAEQTDLFVEVDPNQKERIILALKKMGHVVGFLGDGVNDAPAMHAADTSLSVEQAADVARETADFVLLERGLDVICRGVEEGRTIFANTLKYVLTTMSANLGNMLSMALASLILPFLPLLASQILLNNFLSDVPAIGIATDAVDREMIERPQRWNMRFIARFMVEFGSVSSLFDIATFAALLVVFHAGPAVFRTAWFIESLLTELVIALVVRTRRPFFRSRPGAVLLWSTIAIGVLTPAIPFLPFADAFGFVPISFDVLAAVLLVTAGYVAATEVAKAWFYRNHEHVAVHLTA